jgi:hypothetical protein
MQTPAIKKIQLFVLILLFSSLSVFAQPIGSPVSQNGKLKVVGTQLVNECGHNVQLKGMGTNGIMYFPNCYNESSITALANDWSIDIFEIKINYLDWYVKDTAYARSYVNNLIEACHKMGIYCIVQLQEGGNPSDWTTVSKDMFQYFSNLHKYKKNVLYEILNEPYGPNSNWSACKSFSNQVIPVIRANDPNSVIIVPTPYYNQRVDSAAKDPMTGPNAVNILYSFHFYAASHESLKVFFNFASDKIAIIADEWGDCTYTGSGQLDTTAANQWIGMMAGNNPGKQSVSWANHNFGDGYRPNDNINTNGSCSALITGSCSNSQWNNTSPSGTYIKQKIINPNNSWIACTSLITGIETFGGVNVIDVFPNPATSLFTISFQLSKLSDVTSIIRDLNGKIIYSENDKSIIGQYKKVIDMSRQSKGIYFIEIVNENKRSYKKIVLQ